MRAPPLELDRVSKSFGGFKAVTDMSLVLLPGEIHALIGPNGAGKSTLLNLASGVFAPTAGEVRVLGRDIAGSPPHAVCRRGLARSFQITSIFPRLTVADNVRTALLSRQSLTWRFLAPAAKLLSAEVAELLARVGMGERADAVAGELAAGDRKRLEFAIALALRPQVMLLDEPTAGMSSTERETVVEVVRAINAEGHVAVLFTEHDIDMVFSLAHRVTVMHQGSKIIDGTPAEVRGSARVQEVYLGEAADA